jgi:hypothetical protein
MMNNEEFERKMAFIVNQQAKFEVDIERLHEAQMLTEQKLQETNDVVTRLAYVTNEGFKDVNAKINAMVNSQIALQDSQKQTDNQIKRNNEQTEEKLRRLTETVDRYIRNRHNGD